MHNQCPPMYKDGKVVSYPEKSRLSVYQLPLLVIVAVLVYLSALRNGFVFDDTFTITNNYLICSWSKFTSLFTKEYFAASGELSYRPVVTLSYFIDYSIWQNNPLGYHITNVLFHTINTVILFLLIKSILVQKILIQKHEFIYKTARVSGNFTFTSSRQIASIAFLSSIIFCIHPLLAEAVNAISFREDIIMATFYFAAFFFYLISNHNKSILWHIFSLLCYGLSLFSKEMAVTFPLVIILFDATMHRNVKIVYRKIYYYAGYAAVTIFYILVRFVFLHNPTESYIPYPQDSLWINFIQMSKVIASYIALIFLPINLNADYVVPLSSSVSDASFLLSVFLVISVIIIIFRLFSHSKILFFSALWFLITLLPVLNIIPIENIMAERYLYVPAVGFYIIASHLLYQLLRIKTKNNTAILYCCTSIVTFILMWYSWQTIQRSKIWYDNISLWSATAARSPQSSRAHNNLGIEYKKSGYIDSALREYETAIKIRPNYSEAYSNLANLYIEIGSNTLDRNASPNLYRTSEDYLKKAIETYKKAIEISPFNNVAHFNLGITYGKLGLFNDAEIEYKNSIRLNPNNQHAHNHLENIYEDRELSDMALEEYQIALSIDSNNAITFNNIGNIYLKKELYGNAIQAYEQAVKNNPEGIVFHENLGNAYLKMNLTDKAIAEYEIMIHLQPDNPNYYTNLIALYWNHKKNSEKAIFYLRKLSALQPDQRDSINKMIDKLGGKK